MARSETEGLYDIFCRAMTQPEPSTSLGPPPPKRYRWVPTATVLHLTAKKAKAPSPVPQPQGGDIPASMTPLHVNIGDANWVYHCQVEGCPEGPSSSHATICSHVCCTHLGMKLLCSLFPIMFFNTNTFRWHGKQAHCFGSSEPT